MDIPLYYIPCHIIKKLCIYVGIYFGVVIDKVDDMYALLVGVPGNKELCQPLDRGDVVIV